MLSGRNQPVPSGTGAVTGQVASLDGYREKRNLRRGGEPAASGRGAGPRGRGGRKPRFVVQQHDASTEHYDFRLEADGVLKSWAVPKGPSLDPQDHRLAVATEDLPLGYASFEGVIPAGEYGAGRVIVWDCGYYVNRSHDPRGGPVDTLAAIDRGHISVELHGKKLRGGFALTRMPGRGRDRWLLVKTADEFADAWRRPVRTQPESVQSGKRIEELAGR
jgi:DNA ligase D-like protein (predicted 3'-phosphoesterase)